MNDTIEAALIAMGFLFAIFVMGLLYWIFRFILICVSFIFKYTLLKGRKASQRKYYRDDIRQ